MKFKPAQTLKKSVMFSARFEDGRTGYFVLMGHGGPEEDFLALPAAQERQRLGELPAGVICTVKRVREEPRMSDHEILKQWMLEIGRRLRDGETSVRMKDVMEAAGRPVPSPRDRERLWKEVWHHIEAMGLVVQVHHSSRDPTLVGRVTLTDFGSDPASWDD